MRTIETALNLARICGPGAGFRFLDRAARIQIGHWLYELSSLILLWRARVLRQIPRD